MSTQPGGHSGGCTPRCHGSTEERPQSRDFQKASRELLFDLALRGEKSRSEKEKWEGVLVKGAAQAKAQHREGAWRPLQLTSASSLQIRRLGGKAGAEKSVWTHVKGFIIIPLMFSYRLWEQRQDVNGFSAFHQRHNTEGGRASVKKTSHDSPVMV